MKTILFTLGTVVLLIAYGAISLCCFLTSDRWRRDLGEANKGK